jgi:hypothetical protein
MSTVHTVPVGDLIEHERSGGALCDCVCGPEVEFVANGGVVVVHHSLDGRELDEDVDA